MLATAAGGADTPALPPEPISVSVSIPVPVPVPESVADAPIALLVDLGTGQTLHEHEADRRFIPASITKIMSAYVAFELIDADKLSLDQQYTISEGAFEEWYQTGSTMFLKPDRPVSADVLLRGITGVSANDAAIVLAEGAAGSVPEWLALMNEQATVLGMRNSHFGTPNGWPDGGKTFTTARDLQILSRALIERHPDKFARYFGQPGFAYRGVAQANHDPISGRMRGADGIKTGYTRQAGFGFVGTAIRDGQRLLMVVGGVEKSRQRKIITEDLIEWGFQAFEPVVLFDSDTKIGSARVQDGMAETLALSTMYAISADRLAGNAAEIQLTIHYEGPLRAPIVRGERVAQLEIAIKGMDPFRVPLVAAEDVAQATLGQRLINGLANIFG